MRQRITMGGAEHRLAASRKRSSSVLAGSVQLIGMEEIRRSLDGNWAAVSDKAHAVAERTIAEHLSYGDVFELNQNDTFVVCFARPDKSDAERRTHQIVEAIKIALARELPEAQRPGVSHAVAELEWGDVEDDQGGSLTDMLARSLRRVQEEANETVKVWRRALLREAYVVYRSVWSAGHRENPMYQCLVDEVTGKRTLERLTNVSSVELVCEALAELDEVVLGRAVEGLHAAMQSGTRADLLVPVNFMSIKNQRRREQYIRLCRELPDSYRKFISFEIHSVPLGEPLDQVLDLVHFLKGAVSGVAVGSAQLERYQIDELARGGVFAISTPAGPLSLSRRDVIARYSDFAMLVKSAGMKAMIHGAGTVGLFEAAKIGGIDFVDGNAISYPRDTLKVGCRPTLAQAA
jgi:hypothetical protein